MLVSQTGLTALQERVAPFLRYEGATSGRAIGNVLLAAGVETEPQEQAAEAVLNFAVQTIPPEMVTANIANMHLLEVASSIAARNWLGDIESPEDNRVMADVILGIFSTVPARRLRQASHDFMGLRRQFKPEHRDFDTTTRLMTLLPGMAASDPSGPGRVESFLTDEQLVQIKTIQNRLPRPPLAPPQAMFINGILTYVRA